MLYRRVMDSLVDLAHLHTDNVTSIEVNGSHRSPNDVMHETMKHCFLLGALSVPLYYIAWSNWMTTGERQILRNIRRQEIAWFDKTSTGELNNRLVEDLDKVQD